MGNTAPKVDEFLNQADMWQEEMKQLRSIILECGLTEEFKWRKPCYTFKGRNIIIIQPFNKYLAVMFFKGVLLEDKENILVKPGENSQTQRQMRFTNVEEIKETETILKAYIQEAIEKSDIEVETEEKPALEIPEELQQKFKEMPSFEAAFRALTPGRQRGYLIYFSKAKQSKTRTARIEKYIEKIMDGKGLND